MLCLEQELQLGLQKVVWILDSPVSNSGKLKAHCYELAEKQGFPWEIDHKVWACSADGYAGHGLTWVHIL